MNKSLKNAAVQIMGLPLIGNIIQQVLKIAGKQEAVLKYKRIVAEQKLLHTPGFKEIKSGIFAGMKYPVHDAAGSYLAPKVVGSYESELYPKLQAMFKTKQYKVAFDVGCAEGYYAVGITRAIPGIRMYAYDTNKEAIALCKTIAAANGVADRITFGDFCYADTIANFAFPIPSLIVCDCEGYEAELFTEQAVKNLTHTDVLIELHDHFVPGVTNLLTRRLGSTHELTIIEATQKQPEQYPFLNFLTKEEQVLVLSEGRRGILAPPSMQWLFAEAKATQA
jgi:hypothetical protein